MTLIIRNIKYHEDDVKIAYAKVKLNLLKNKLNKFAGKKERFMSESDYEFLIKNYGIKPVEEIAEKIKRKPNAVRKLAGQIGLTFLYLDDDEIILENLYKKLSCRNSDTYNKKLIIKWGLKYRKNGKFYIIKMSDFFEWYKKHIRLINIHDYKIGTFENEPDWFVEKAKADNRAWKYLYKHKWTDNDDAALKKMVEENKGYLEISRSLKRTGPAIKRRCYDLKIKKPKRKSWEYWSEEELNLLKELWLKGYEPCIISEELKKRSDREVISMLERYEYFGMEPQKFTYIRGL